MEKEIHAALLLILLFVAVVALSWLPFVAMGYGPLDSLFEVVSATGTVVITSYSIHYTKLYDTARSTPCSKSFRRRGR